MKEADLYIKAQCAIAELKGCIFELLNSFPEGLSNAEIGKTLGIYQGHSNGQEGHVSRTLLALMEMEQIVAQNKKTKLWSLRSN